MTPDEANALAERMGTKAAAARHLGVAWSTFDYWTNPEKGKKRFRRHYEANRERIVQREREHYENLSGFQYNRKMLKKRRADALLRMARRNCRRKKDEAA
jgi:hypothetical protein